MAIYTCLLLDVDNTLLDFDAAERQALTAMLQEYDLPHDAQALSTHADLIPGALNALEELGEVATLATVSNGATAVQQPRIQDSGIGRYMDGVYISEKVGCAKPSARLFEHVLKDLGITNRSRVLMVGDDLLADIKGGQNVGLDTCWVNFKNEENHSGVEPTYEIHSYEELYRIVMEPEELENLGVRNRRHSNEA